MHHIKNTECTTTVYHVVPSILNQYIYLKKIIKNA